MRKKHLLFTVIFFLTTQLRAQPGHLIPSFGQFGLVVDPDGSSSYTRMGIQPSGKPVVLNNVTGHVAIIRYNTDGTLDNSFGNSGKLILNAQNSNEKDMVIQNDGKIVVVSNDVVMRFTVDGAPDVAFGTNGTVLIQSLGVSYAFSNLALGVNNEIVLAGKANFLNLDHLALARLKTDGTYDTDFNGGGIRIVVENDNENYLARSLAIDAGNNLLVGVSKGMQTASVHKGYLTKYKSNGTVDLSFSGDGKLDTDYPPRDLQVSSAGVILFTTLDLHTFDPASAFSHLLFKASATGTEVPFIGIYDASFQPDGKIIAAGIVENSINDYPKLWVRRFLGDGSLDRSFGDNGVTITDLNFRTTPHSIVYKNRRVFAAGDFSTIIDNYFKVFGFIAAYDGSDAKLNCPDVQSSYSTDAGKCIATVTGINPVMSTSTLYANVKYKLEYGGSVIEEGEGGVSGKEFQLGTTKVTYTYTDITTQTCSFSITATDNDPPVARCKNITVQLNSTGTAFITASQVDNGSTDGCGIQSMSLSKASFDCSNVGENTVILTVTDVHGNSSACTSTVTIEDKTPPVAKTKNAIAYLNETGTAVITEDEVDDGSSDECGSVTLSLDKTSFTCSDKGTNEVTLTVTDRNGNSSTAKAIVTVADNLPPVISSVVASPSGLWPSDRKMKPVTISTAATDNCGVYSWRITGVAIKSGTFANDNVGPDWEITGDHTVNLRAEIPKKGEKRIYTITVTSTDASGNTTTSTTDVVVSYNIISPKSGAVVKVGSTVALNGEFWDVPGKTHSAKWLIDGNTLVKAPLTEPSGFTNGDVTGSYKFNTPGVYKIQMNITDQGGVTTYANTNENLEAIIVVYDPNGGYAYGGGSFNSPAGALTNNPSITGDVSYGFTVNYYKTATNPKGETQFDFKLGDFEYNALNFDYLVISGAKAQFKGTGKITGGQSGINFIMTVVDGRLDGTGSDKVRMKIYNRNTGEVFYDNQPGESDAADPTTAVGAGSLVVISSNVANTSTAREKSEEQIQIAAASLEAHAYPNPTSSNFKLTVNSSNRTDKITWQVMDVSGRVIETGIITFNQTISFGQRYRPGAYYVRIMQGKEQKQIKLIKLND